MLICIDIKADARILNFIFMLFYMDYEIILAIS